jgi:hypothetical protein
VSLNFFHSLCFPHISLVRKAVLGCGLGIPVRFEKIEKIDMCKRKNAFRFQTELE